jgi:tetratricopeptide (TPR) repeat protein
MSVGKSAAKIGIAVCLTWILLAGNVALSQMAPGWGAKRGREKMPRDNAEALQWAEEALAKSRYRVNKIDSQYLLYGDDKGNYGIALARVVSTSMRESGGYSFWVSWQDYAHEQPEAVEIEPRYAAKFVAAVEYLAGNARQEESERDERDLAQFHAQAAAWREAAVKPTMPESAREHQVLAEYAFKERNADKAISEYMGALSIFPTWPEGQYNLATLAGEKHFYETAVFHMKEYLELVPESSDAQAAKDAIIVWKDRLNSLPTVAANTAGGQGPRKFK